MLEKHKIQRKILLGLFLLAIFCRFVGPLAKHAYDFQYTPQYLTKPFISSGGNFINYSYADEEVYNFTAISLVNGYGFALNPIDTYFHGGKVYKTLRIPINNNYVAGKDGYFKHKAVPPVYSMFLAIFYRLFGINTLSFFLPQILLGGLTCVLLYLIAKEVFNEIVAIITCLMVIVYPDLVFWTYMVRVETLFIFLIALAFWLLLRKDFDQNCAFAVIIGMIIGFACLTRIIFIFFVPIIIIWKYVSWEGEDKKSKLIWLLILFLSCSVILSAWAIRNYVVFHSFTILTDEAGTIFKDYSNHKIISTDGSTVGYVGKSYLQQYANFIWDHPYEFVSKSFKRLIVYLSPFTQVNVRFAKIYKGLTWIFVFPAAFWGIILAAKKCWSRSSLLILFILFYIVFHSLTFVDAGLAYRYPIQPFLCVFAAYSYWLIYKRFVREKT